MFWRKLYLLLQEVVKEETSLGHRGLLTMATPANVQAPPGSILVASKDGSVRVETVEATPTATVVPALPTVPASVEEAKKHQLKQHQKQQQEELNRQQQQQQQQQQQIENNSKQANTVAVAAPKAPTVAPPQAGGTSSATPRSYIVTSSSRQNLDSIVEAIRHLEGDHLFNEDSSHQQQVRYDYEYEDNAE